VKSPEITERALARLIAAGEWEHQFDGKALTYRPARDVVVLELVNGVKLEIPRSAIGEIANLPSSKLKEMCLNRFGTAIEIRSIDMDISVSGLTRDLIGVTWASRGGRARSPAKAAASRRNGRKGGRPRKNGARRKAA